VISLGALLLSLLLSAWCILKAATERANSSRQLTCFLSGLEARTRDEESAPIERLEDQSCNGASELFEWLDDALQDKSQGRATLALRELESHAAFSMSRSRELARGLSKIALLGAGGASIVIFALGGFSQTSLTHGGICLVLGLLSSLVSMAVMKQSVRFVIEFSDMAASLASKVENHWKQA